MQLQSVSNENALQHITTLAEVRLELFAVQWAPAPPALPRHCLAPALTFIWYGTAAVALLWDCLAEASIEVGRVGTFCVVLYVFGRGRRLIGLYWRYRCRRSYALANLSYVE